MADGKEIREEEMDQVNGGFQMPFSNLMFKSTDKKEASILETENIMRDASKLGRAMTAPAGVRTMPSAMAPVEVEETTLKQNVEKPSIC